MDKSNECIERMRQQKSEAEDVLRGICPNAYLSREVQLAIAIMAKLEECTRRLEEAIRDGQDTGE